MSDRHEDLPVTPGELRAAAAQLTAPAAEYYQFLLTESATHWERAEQLIADILEERKDELDKASCDRCQDCGETFMCSFHSVLSALQGHVWTNGAIERDNLRRQLAAVKRSRDE